MELWLAERQPVRVRTTTFQGLGFTIHSDQVDLTVLEVDFLQSIVLDYLKMAFVLHGFSRSPCIGKYRKYACSLEARRRAN
jgi:hypothetical protein